MATVETVDENAQITIDVTQMWDSVVWGPFTLALTPSPTTATDVTPRQLVLTATQRIRQQTPGSTTGAQDSVSTVNGRSVVIAPSNNEVVWASSDVTKVTVSASGLATGAGNGAAVITATFHGVTASVTVTGSLVA